DSTVTDTNGNYSIKLDSGTYTITATGDSGLAYQDSIKVINGDTAKLPSDTLKPAGRLCGTVRLEEGGDPTTVFILFMGTRTFTWPDDSSGSFTTDSMAEGKYRIRIITTLDNYKTLDTVLSITSGRTDTMPDTIVLKYTGIPTPKNVAINYDTMKQIVTLTWDRLDTTLAASYNVYRRNVDSNTVFTRINSSPVADTIYADSTGVQDQTYEYMVAAVDKNNTEGTKSAGVSVKVVGAFVLIDSVNLGYGAGNSEIIFNGDSLLAIRTNDKITVLDTALKVLSTFDLPTNFGNGSGVMIDQSNKIWASNYTTGQVNVYSLNGLLVDSLRDSAIHYPTVIREDHKGQVFINTSIGAYVNEIRIYSDSAKFISLFSNNSSSIKTNVDDMLFDKTDNMTILNRIDSTVTIYDNLGNIAKTGKLKSYTVEIQRISNGYYIVKQDGNSGILNVLDSEFKLISIFGTGLGIDYRDFGTIAIDNLDRLFVRRGNQVLRYKISK
ncbi:MAG TPA: hypothetical protein DCO75_12310, partial [Fibrobacteres bacterium]|nr:hypothetical protein [Fibrobacterota bacterium]